ncbi:MAG: HAD hydrolase family protein, partial [Clostridia bacterium]|nr:HAD hydrolase family protein [Clostridia bacterium]
MIKAIFFDLDGTLLNDEKKMLPSTYKALSLCRKNGVKVFLNTARAPLLGRMIDWGEDEFSLFYGGIYCNGACEQVNGGFHYTFLDGDIVDFAVDKVKNYPDLHFAMQTRGEVHLFNHYLPDTLLEPWGISRDMAVSTDKPASDSIVKILIYYNHLVDNDRPLPEELYGIFAEYCGNRAHVYLTDKGKTIQIGSNKVSKLTSTTKTVDTLGISPDEVAVFGDDINDIEMLSSYANSVAMGNAEESVKSVA